MTKRVAVFTATRAEYGLLRGLMKALDQAADFDLQILVSGTHLVPLFGGTLSDIVADGFTVTEKVDMLLASDTPNAVAKSMGLATIGYADALDRMAPDMLIVLGDRYELLTIAQVAVVMGIPLVHLYGGEITEGAIDDSIRHAITKLSSMHFVATETYRNRVIQMGEKPDMVFNVGALGLDAIRSTPRMSREEFCGAAGIDSGKPYFLLTYHAATQGTEDPKATFEKIIEALKHYQDFNVLITYPNADPGGRVIIDAIESLAAENPQRYSAVKSLGARLYFGAMAHAAAVVGNSSSGIIEAPAFVVPTVNVGIRQKGRLRAKSVINCSDNVVSIRAALETALEPEFRCDLAKFVNPYGSGDSVQKIMAVLRDKPVCFVKSFNDLMFFQG